MKYYFLDVATNKKETGVLGPQCMAFPTGYSLEWYDRPNSMDKVTNDKFPDNDTEFIFELDPRAKTTDFISQSIIPARGFLISQKARSILELFALPEHRYYQAKLLYKETILEYSWLHLLDNDYSQIDYSLSRFYHGRTQNWKVADVSINSYEEIKQFQRQLKFIFAESLELKPALKNKNYDLLLFSDLHYDVFISKKIAGHFIQEKITGYKIHEQEILV